MDLIIL